MEVRVLDVGTLSVHFEAVRMGAEYTATIHVLATNQNYPQYCKYRLSLKKKHNLALGPLFGYRFSLVALPC